MPRRFRPVLLIAVLACVHLASAAFAETPVAEPITPKIAFEITEIAFPRVKEGQTLTAQFPFSNQGKMDLVIDSVTTSCGCTVARFDKVTNPGGKGMIHLELQTSGISGSYRKTAVVNTNDPANPSLNLVIEVVPILRTATLRQQESAPGSTTAFWLHPYMRKGFLPGRPARGCGNPGTGEGARGCRT